MSWFIDNAGSWYLLLGLVTVGFGAAFYVTRRVKWLGAAGAALAAMALVWLLTKLVITDRRQLELNVRAMADAVVEGKAEVLLKHFAKDFKFQGRSRENVAQGVTSAARQHGVNDIHLYQFQVEEISRSKGTATMFFRATAYGGQESLYMAACRAYFVLEGDQWRLKEVRFYNPVVNQDQPLQLPIP